MKLAFVCLIGKFTRPILLSSSILAVASFISCFYWFGFRSVEGVFSIPIFGAEDEPLPFPDHDYLTEKLWPERTGVFLSSYDGKPEESRYIGFSTLSLPGMKGGSRSISFRFDRKAFIAKQFDLSDRAWSILLFTELWRLFAKDARSPIIDPTMSMTIPVALDLDEPRYRAYLEVAFQITSLADRTTYQFVSTKEIVARGAIEDLRFPLNEFLLDRTYQPKIPIEVITTGNDQFDRDKSGIVEQVQFKIIFTDPVPESLDVEGYDDLLSRASIIPSDAMMVKDSYGRSGGGFAISPALRETDVIRLAAIRHIDGLDLVDMKDASGSIMYANPRISYNKPVVLSRAAKIASLVAALIFIVIIIVIISLLSIIERQKNIVRKVLIARTVELEENNRRLESLIAERLGVGIHGKPIDHGFESLIVTTGQCDGRTSPIAVDPVDIADIYDLSARERSVLETLKEGRSDKAIAEALGLSPRTVSNYVARLLKKTGFRSRYELAIIAKHDALVGKRKSD